MMKDVVEVNAIDDATAPEIEFSEVVRRYEDGLTDQQLRALPYISYGVSLSRVADILGVSVSSVRKWMKEPVFSAALRDARAAMSKWHASMLDAVAVRAWERAWEIINNDVDPDDKVGRQEQARMTRFVLEQLGLKTHRKEVTHKFDPGPALNVSDDTIDIIARKLHELENTIDAEEAKVTDIDYDYDPSKFGQVAVHPETKYGVLNVDGRKLQCHLCGGWYLDLRLHAESVHGMSANAYKKAFGLSRDVRIGVERLPIDGDDTAQ